ncbi:sodium Bile acid symporter family isoform X2 [Tasmannia lanceolata]|uniref:sodium Bile acid symporter family isoform X2 n=1 Tax=Tasmannia lanceolata TaxID=3420 RepID=UPI00406457CC
MQCSLALSGISITAKNPTYLRQHRTNKTPPLLLPLSSSSSSLGFPCSNHGVYTIPISNITTISITRRRNRPTETALTPLFSINSPDKSGSESSISSSIIHRLQTIGEILSALFPLWVASACLLGLFKPSSFHWVQQKWQILGITLTMLGMGMTLTLDDLRGAMAMPKELLSGFILQYTVMTPFLTAKLAGQFVAVDAAGLFFSTVQVVLGPVLFGAVLNQYCHDVVKVVSPFMPVIAVATVAILCGSAIAQNAAAILMSGRQVVLGACLLHASGFSFGYILSRMLGLDVSSSRTVSIEVGMQNSVLGVVLAGQHFSDPLTAVPCAVSSVCHSIYGSVLAGIWRFSSSNQKED